MENALAAEALVRQARRSVDIYTLELDQKIYNQSPFIDAVKSFVLNNSSAKLRVLICKPNRTIKTGHRLINLARHLSSYTSIRVVHEDYAGAPDAFLAADRCGILHVAEANRYEGICNFNKPRLAVELSNRFDEVWNHSMEIAEFRHVYI